MITAKEANKLMFNNSSLKSDLEDIEKLVRTACNDNKSIAKYRPDWMNNYCHDYNDEMYYPKRTRDILGALRKLGYKATVIKIPRNFGSSYILIDWGEGNK